MPQPGAARPASGWQPANEFDEYRLLRLIGRGGNGLVYAAHDTLLDRLVAIKFVLDVREGALARFLVEARAAARIQHPNVAALYRVGELDNRPYLVSEFVHGQTLDRIKLPLPPARALEIAIGLTRGLAMAHRLGILHRDLKPSNAIVAESGEVKLLDFGLAKFLDDPAPEKREDALPITLPNLTQPGGLVGTPFYMAPEMWRGELATRRSDLYSLGALVYELCTGSPPFGDVAPAELPKTVETQDAPPTAQRAPAVEPGFAAVIDRCLLRNPHRRFGSADELLAALEQLSPAVRRGEMPEGNPYRGLQAFGPEHRAVFFGRSVEVRAILERLRSTPFVLLAGDSGVGKSSLAGAGLLPLVGEGALGEGRAWTIARLVPGRHPVESLAAALAEALGADEESIRELLREPPVEVARHLRKRLRATGGLLVFVDQLEELVTMNAGKTAAQAAEALAMLCGSVPGLRLLATARSDFLARLAALPGLGDEIERALVLLRPLSPEGIREAITGPAAKKDVHFESDALVETLLESTTRTDGGLPLLQFTLAELWEARDREKGILTASALETIGGVSGALARHADGVVDRMLPAQRDAARRMLLRLVTLDGTRARRSEDELCRPGDRSARAALDALVRGRLLVARVGREGASYEVAHEALLSGWTRLRNWLEEALEERAARERLDAAAAEWERLGRAREGLWSARQLADIANLRAADLGTREAAFVEASRRAVRRRKILVRAAAVAVPLATAVLWAGVRLHGRHEIALRVAQHLAQADTLVAAANEKAATHRKLAAQAFALWDRHDAALAERVWAQAIGVAGDLERTQARIAQELDQALALDGTSGAARARLGDLILARGLTAIELRRVVDRAEISARLRSYDDDGSRRRTWDAPARVSIATTPPGARVQLARYETEDSGRRVERLVADLGTAPISDRTLEPGSYVLVLDAPGRAAIRYPFVASRGESLPLRIALPPAHAIPSGFIYVPAGRFLFGSAGDEDLRRDFYNTTPLRETQTGAYLIARNETTFADWIQFLSALPESERRRRLPQTSGSHHGRLDLRQGRGAWELVLEPNDKAYTAAVGQPIIYEQREHRARQDWLRMPVSAVSFEDVEAYTRWLAQTGRVPGARPCSESEWERAARGADDRLFPHGDRLEPDDANYDKTYGQKPSAFGPDEVGAHPASRSPFGVDDMAGNVWELTRSVLADGGVVARGGSFFNFPLVNQSVNRETVPASFRDLRMGVRVCADAPRD